MMSSAARDTKTNDLVASVPVGRRPQGVAVDPRGRLVYVTNFADDSVSAIEITRQAVLGTIPVGGGPEGIAIHPDGRRVYVANFIQGTISVIDNRVNSVVASISVDGLPVGIAIETTGERAFVSLISPSPSNRGKLVAIDTTSGRIAGGVQVGVFQLGVSITPDGRHIYVANSEDDTVSVVDAATLAVIKDIPVGDRPVAVAFSPNGGVAYVTNQNSNDVSVVDTLGTVVAMIPVGAGPTGASVNPDGSRVYITNVLENSVAVIETESNTVLTFVAAGGDPVSFGHFISPSASQLIKTLITDLELLNVQQGIQNSFDAKLQAAQRALGDLRENNAAAAIGAMEAFIQAVETQRWTEDTPNNKIVAEEADALIAQAQLILELLRP